MTLTEVTKEITAENTFSDALIVKGEFNFSLVDTSSFIGIVTIQRRFFAADPWRDINTYTGQFEGYDTNPGGEMRFGVKTGDYTSGTLDGRLANARS